MEWAVKARRPDEECHSLSFYQNIGELVNSSMSSSPGQGISKSLKKVQNWLTQMEDIKARQSPFRKIKCNNGRQLGILKKTKDV